MSQRQIIILHALHHCLAGMEGVYTILQLCDIPPKLSAQPLRHAERAANIGAKGPYFSTQMFLPFLHLLGILDIDVSL